MTIGTSLSSRAQTTADRQTVFTRQHQVEHDEIEVLPMQRPIHGLAITDRLDRESLFHQVAGQQFPQASVVVDQ
jgi:hypothetical protein